MKDYDIVSDPVLVSFFSLMKVEKYNLVSYTDLLK